VKKEKSDDYFIRLSNNENIEEIVEEEDHKGMIYNPFTKKWSFGIL